MASVNPPPHELGRVNAIVGGRARRYGVANFSAPLSVKAVLSGLATWTTAAGRFDIGPSGCLIVNDGEEYSMEVDSLQPVETFCIFFARGFVEDAHRSTVTGTAELLDNHGRTPLEFAERLQSDAKLLQLIRGGPTFVGRGAEAGPLLDEHFAFIAQRLVEIHTDVNARIARLPSLRSSTREEIRRRLHRAVATIHGDLAGDLALERIAAEACLAPFHFHRLFTSYFGETPHRYVVRLRLERAAALLRGSDRPVADIAFDCGFASIGSFSTLFAKHFGAPPARFRKIRECAGSSPRLH